MLDDVPSYAPDGLIGGSPTSPAGDSIHLLAVELDEEEQELWRQLRRKRDFETRVLEKRAQLQELRERRRKVSSQHAELTASVEHLTDEVAFSHEQVREVEHDIAVLTESNRILQQAFSQQSGANALANQGMDPSSVLADEKSRQESIQLEHDQIKHLRAHLAKLREEKDRMQHKQRTLFEKQRSAEQDRNRLLGTLQDDRSSINEVRQERIRLWEDRSKMEQEMARIVHEAHVATNGVTSMLSSSRQAPGTAGSFRAPAMHDANAPEAFAGSAQETSSYQAGPAPTRSHWTGFGEQTSAAALGPAQSGSHLGGQPDRDRAPSFGDARTDGSEFGSQHFGEGAAGITEWSDKFHNFRSSRAPDRAF